LPAQLSSRGLNALTLRLVLDACHQRAQDLALDDYLALGTQ
jgi:hypothetical protein